MHLQSLVTVTTFTQKRRAAVILTGHSCALGADTHPELCVVTINNPKRPYLLYGGLSIGVLTSWATVINGLPKEKRKNLF